jgi:hypothetical protein
MMEMRNNRWTKVPVPVCIENHLTCDTPLTKFGFTPAPPKVKGNARCNQCEQLSLGDGA